MTFQDNGRHQGSQDSPSDLVEYLGPIEQQPETQTEPEAVPQPQPQPLPATEPQPVPEPDAELRIRLLKQANDSQAETIGRLLSEARDLNMEIGGLERQLSERDARIRDVETMHAAAAQAVVDAGKGNDKLRAQVEELRSEVAYVQNLLGESRQRVTHLEELVSSLRTINDAQEAAVKEAGRRNDALRVQVRILQQEADKKNSRIEFLETLNAGNGAAIGDYIAKVAKLQSLVDTARGQLEAAATEHDSLSTQLAAVKAELVTQAETSRRLQIELDAAQQVPADSPELRQLRADLEQMTRERDQYLDSYQRIFGDLETIRESTKAETVEAILEWLEPVRATIEAADNVQQTMRADNLACDIIRNLPGILRYVVGLNHPEEIE